jgi:hypothetical protein
LISGLCEHSTSPQLLIDPLLGAERRDKNLSRFADRAYVLTVAPIADFRFVSAGRAELLARVHFKSVDTEVDADSTISFVKRNGTWYFANYDFVSFPTTLIVVIALSVLMGIAYAAVIINLRIRLGHRIWQDLVWLKVFVPVFWPSLYRLGRSAPHGAI